MGRCRSAHPVLSPCHATINKCILAHYPRQTIYIYVQDFVLEPYISIQITIEIFSPFSYLANGRFLLKKDCRVCCYDGLLHLKVFYI